MYIFIFWIKKYNRKTLSFIIYNKEITDIKSYYTNGNEIHVGNICICDYFVKPISDVKKQYWMHPLISSRFKGQFYKIHDLRIHPNKFF